MSRCQNSDAPLASFESSDPGLTNNAIQHRRREISHYRTGTENGKQQEDCTDEQAAECIRSNRCRNEGDVIFAQVRLDIKRNFLHEWQDPDKHGAKGTTEARPSQRQSQLARYDAG